MRKLIAALAMAVGTLTGGAVRANSEPAKDAFQGVDECRIVDTYNQPVDGHALGVRPTMEQAGRLLAPCLEGVSKKYGVTVSAVLDSPITTTRDGSGTMNPRGINIVLNGYIDGGNTVEQDLYYAIKTRGGELLTYPVALQGWAPWAEDR